MIHLELTRDWKLVREIVTHPAIWDHVSDDYSPPRERWQPVDHPSLCYVLVRDDTLVLGLWMFEVKGACWEVHTCLLPCAWGDRAKRAAAEMAAWLWANTPCHRLITSVPADNRLALRFAERAGMKQFGINEKAYLKGGKLQDLILLGLSRPEGK